MRIDGLWACAVAGVFCGLTAVATGGARAQVHYAPYPYYAPETEAIYPFGVPDADRRSGSYTFEVLPATRVGPVVRVGRRCTYPDGWNVTDFSRDVNGIPPGINHVCR